MLFNTEIRVVFQDAVRQGNYFRETNKKNYEVTVRRVLVRIWVCSVLVEGIWPFSEDLHVTYQDRMNPIINLKIRIEAVSSFGNIIADTYRLRKNSSNAIYKSAHL